MVLAVDISLASPLMSGSPCGIKGTTTFNEEAVNHLQISPQYLEQEKLHKIDEIRRRKSLFLGAAGGEYDLNDKTVILVDDGAATGATIIVGARSIRKRFKLKRLIIALPIARKDTVRLLKKEADLVEPFYPFSCGWPILSGLWASTGRAS